MMKTFLMIKPDGYKYRKEIIDHLKSRDLKIEKIKEVKVNMDVMQILLKHYEEVIDRMGKDFNFPGKLFNSFYFDNQYIVPMIVSSNSDNIIEKTRSLVGATNPKEAKLNTLRYLYSDDDYEKADLENRLVNNVIHASDSIESAKREIELWETIFK